MSYLDLLIVSGAFVPHWIHLRLKILIYHADILGHNR
jgi:hypothetical protein